MQQGCSLDEAYKSPLGMDLSKEIEAAMSAPSRNGPVLAQPTQYAAQTHNEFTLGTDFTKQGLMWQAGQPLWQPVAPMRATDAMHASPARKQPIEIDRLYAMLVDIMQRLDEIQAPKPKPTHQATDIIMFLMVGLFLIFAIDACVRGGSRY